MALVAWLRLDETTGTSVADYSGSNTGTLVGSPVWQKDHQGIKLNGTTQYVTVANEANFDFERTDTFSVSAWIRQDNLLIGDGQAVIVGKLLNSGGFSGWEIAAQDPAGGAAATVLLNFYLINTTPSNQLRVSANNVFTVGKTYHVVVTYAGTSLASGVKFYLNGNTQALVDSGNVLSASILNATPVLIGARVGPSHLFAGMIHDVRIYNHVLTAGEVTTLYGEYGPYINNMDQFPKLQMLPRAA